MLYYRVCVIKSGVKGFYRLEKMHSVLRMGMGKHNFASGHIEIMTIENQTIYTANSRNIIELMHDKKATWKNLFCPIKTNYYIIYSECNQLIGSLWKEENNLKNKKEKYHINIGEYYMTVLIDKDESLSMRIMNKKKEIAFINKGMFSDENIFYDLTTDISEMIDIFFLFIVYFDVIHTNLNAYYSKPILPLEKKCLNAEMIIK